MYKKDGKVIVEKNGQVENTKEIHEGKAIIILTTIYYQAFNICFNPNLLEWKQNLDFIKGETKFSPTQNSQLTTFLCGSSPISLLEIT